MKLSIIVPVYNVEKYVERCIRSIISQRLSTNDEFEVVIVNDGSQDNSMAIVNDVVRSSDNVKIIDQRNKGLSVARNVGLQNCSGEFIWFVDSDDWIQPNSINTILSIFKTNENIDIISFLLNNVEEETNEITTCCFNKYLNKRDIVAGSQYVFFKGAFAPVQRFAFRKDYLIKNDFNFFSGIYHEDGEFGLRVLYCCPKLYLLKEPLYNYMLRRSGSIMSSIKIKNIYDLMIVYNNLKEFGDNYVSRQDTKYWNATISQWFIYMFDYSRKFITSQDFMNFYIHNRSIINKNVLCILNSKVFSFKMSVSAILIRFFPYLYIKYVTCHYGSK